MEIVSEARSHGGRQLVCKHASNSTGTDMTFAVFLPPQSEGGATLPVVWYLSGLTCTHANVTDKGEYRRACAQLGLMLVAPDTSPRDANVPGEDEDWDFGTGAGFYVDATEEPWSQHYKMYSYLTQELPSVVGRHFPARPDAAGVVGHSMGGHGALVCALKNPNLFRSVSAFAPISAPPRVPWGEKAFTGYLGGDREAWKAYDASEIVRGHPFADGRNILVDQGLSDQFLEEQLLPEVLEEACAESGQPLTLNRREGYDHSYYTISTFMEDHIRHHAAALEG